MVERGKAPESERLARTVVEPEERRTVTGDVEERAVAEVEGSVSSRVYSLWISVMQVIR